MRRFALLLALLAFACAKPAPPPVVPLTVDEWKALAREEKYKPDTLERLKEGNPSLNTPEGWDTFSRTVLTKERRKDYPKGR